MSRRSKRRSPVSAAERITDPVELKAIIDALALPDLILDKSLQAVERWLADERNLALRIDEDVGLFEHFADGIYEVHTLIRSGGRTGLAHAKQAMAHMAEHHDATAFFGETPIRDDLRHAHLFNRLAGFKPIREVERPFGRCVLYLNTGTPRA